jgi:hypothetical protein
MPGVCSSPTIYMRPPGRDPAPGAVKRIPRRMRMIQDEVGRAPSPPGVAPGSGPLSADAWVTRRSPGFVAHDRYRIPGSVDMARNWGEQVLDDAVMAEACAQGHEHIEPGARWRGPSRGPFARSAGSAARPPRIRGPRRAAAWRARISLGIRSARLERQENNSGKREPGHASSSPKPDTCPNMTGAPCRDGLAGNNRSGEAGPRWINDHSATSSRSRSVSQSCATPSCCPGSPSSTCAFMVRSFRRTGHGGDARDEGSASVACQSRHV